MKKILLTGWLLCLMLNLCGQTAKRPRCVATMTIITDIARNLGEPEVEVRSLLPVGSDPHTYEPVPGDVQLLLSAQVILKNGLHLEGWLDELINQSGTKGRIHTVTESIPALTDPDHAGSFDPHAWMNPLHGIVYAEQITNAFIQLLPEKKTLFQSRLQAYTTRLLETDRHINNLLQQIPKEKRVLVTSHDAFRYFGQRYGWEVASALGTSTDAEIRTQDMQRLAETIRSRGLKAVFIENVLNPKVIEQVAQDNGAVVGGKLFADSIGDSLSPAGTYVGMLRTNAETIFNGLSGKHATASVSGEKHEPDGYLGSLFWVLVIVFLGAAAGALAYTVRKKATDKRLSHPFTLQTEGVWVSYDKKTVLANIYISIESGQVWGLIGPNGSGKSTLFKTILGLIHPDAGTVHLNGQPLTDFQTRIAYVPQKEEIDWSFPATVEEIVLTGRYAHVGVFQPLQETDRDQARQALERLQLTDFKDRQISELSGGQQQRTFIARALCQEADIYLFDEPFVGVDVTTEAKIVDLMHALAREGKLVIIVHHDLAKVPDYFDAVILIHQRIIAYGSTAEVFTPENLEKTFTGRSEILDKTDRYL